MIVECIAPVLVPSIWDRVRPMIEAGYAAADEFMPEDMLDRLVGAKVQLWGAIGDRGDIFAVLTTELVPMRSGLVCWMCQCAGERLGEWREFHRKVEDYARAEGCVKVVLRGRVGWQRALDGYQVRNVQLEKVL